MIFDSHCHYNDRRFREEHEDYQGFLDGIFRSGEFCAAVSGWDVESSADACRIAGRYPGTVYATVGIHPCNSQRAARLDRSIEDLAGIIASNRCRVVAVGETGYDFHYDDTDETIQRLYFDAQIDLARSLGLPVVIHDRDAHNATYAAISRNKDVRFMLHSFSGSAEMARQLLRYDCWFSFSGTVSFKNATSVREALAAVPRDRVMAETDCPYLAPHPFRGRTNDSTYMVHTIRAMADAMGIDYAEAVELTSNNSKRFYNIENRS